MDGSQSQTAKRHLLAIAKALGPPDDQKDLPEMLESRRALVHSGLVRRFGGETAMQMARFSLMNIDRVMSMVKDMDPEIQAESEIREFLKVVVPRDEHTWRESTSSLEAFRKGFPEHKDLHRIVEKEDLATDWNIGTGFGALVHKAGAVWPYRLVAGIFQRLLAQYPDRLSIETNTPVTDIEHLVGSNGVKPEYPYAVKTPSGTVFARQIIHCANAHASHLLRPLIGKMYPFRGTMSVQKAGPDLQNAGNDASWSLVGKTSLDPRTGLYNGGLYYLQQNAVTGDIWVGAESAHISEILQSDDTTVPGHSAEELISFLPNYLARGWPAGRKPEIRGMWSGLQCHTADELPLVGKVPGKASGRLNSDGEWISGGYIGYGMDKAWLCGEALVKMIAGEGVPEWLPEAFVMTESRFEQSLTLERALDRWASILQTSDKS